MREGNVVVRSVTGARFRIGLIMFEEVLDMGAHHGGFRPGGWKWNRGGREW